MRTMNREYHKWYTHRLGREMELLVFGHSGTRILIFPTRGGRFFEYENMRMVECLKPQIEGGKLQLFCLDSIDEESFYCWWAHPEGRIQRHLQYERYILEEVFPFMELKNAGSPLMAHGCSLGAFHATNIAFRYPELFQKLVAFSGRFDLTASIEYFADLFDGYYNDDIYFNTPSHFLSGLNCSERLRALRAMEITFVIGADDPFKDNNESLSSILREKGVMNELYIWGERAHRAHYWRQMAPLYIKPPAIRPAKKVRAKKRSLAG